MSDTSYDSIDSMNQPIEDTFIALSNDEVQIKSSDENSKHIQVEQEEVENEEIVNPADQVSDALGYPDITTKKNFKSTLISKVEHEITENGQFPCTDPDTLNNKIAKNVDVALGRALRTYAQKKYEKQFWRKYEAALRNSMEGFETDMENSGL